MDAGSPDADQTAIGSSPKEPAQAPVSWGSRQKSRGHAPLKLLGARRGEGKLVWTGGSVPAAYELDIYSRGPMRTASGNLEGDFSRLLSKGEIKPQFAKGCRLRLDDGRELAIELVFLEPSAAGFEAHEMPAGVDFLSR